MNLKSKLILLLRSRFLGFIGALLFCVVLPLDVRGQTGTTYMSDTAADLVGVNTHINYAGSVYDTRYADIIKPRLIELGVRHIRDNAGAGVFADRYVELAGSGIKLLLVNSSHDHINYVKALNARGPVVEAVEPPNESDNGSLMGPATGPVFMRDFMNIMYPAYKADPATRNITVLGPSFARTSTSPALFARTITNASTLMDAGNVHDYPGGTYPEGPGGGGWGITLPEALNRYKALSGTKPIWSTETGYKMSGSVPGHPAVSERTAAKYMLRLFMMHMQLGVPRVYPYQLINNREDFGLLNNDGSPRQQFTAMKNFITMFKDPGAAFTPGTLGYTLTGDMTNIQQMLLQKRDGRFLLVVWQGVNSGEPPRRALTLTLTSPVTTATLYEPTFSLTPVNQITDPAGITSIPLSVPDHLLVIELIPGDCEDCTPGPAPPGPGPGGPGPIPFPIDPITGCPLCGGPNPPPPPPGPCGGKSGLPWASGVSPGTGDGRVALTNVNGFSTWRGRPVDVGILFIGQNSWGNSYAAFLTNEVLRPDGAVRAFSQNGICPVLTVPLVTKADAMKFAMVAAGDIDAEHAAVARKIHEAVGEGTIYLRLGHEADHGYPWSYTNEGPAADPATYRAAWARIAKIYKTEMPNARLVWNTLKNTRLKITDYYPGDDVVDVLSLDPYDNGFSRYCDSAANWTVGCLGSWNPATGEAQGVAGMLGFAKSRGKRMAADEWGATNDSHTPGNGANNDYYVAAMYDFFNANRDYIEYESYYNRAGEGRHQIWPRVDYNAKPSDAYLAKYKGDVPIPPLTPPPAANCPPPVAEAPFPPPDPGVPGGVLPRGGWGVLQSSGNIGAIRAFSAMVQRPINMWETFYGWRQGWEPIENGYNTSMRAIVSNRALGLRAIISYAPFPASEGFGEAPLRRCAAGEFDEHYRKFGEKLKAIGAIDPVFRVGWEWNSDYPFGIDKHLEWGPLFANCFRHVVSTLRASYPGNQFVFDFNPTQFATTAELNAAWPGPEYVDIVGIDAYDRSFKRPCDEVCFWEQVSGRINTISAFAKSVGKPISFPEWGVWTSVTADFDGGGGDNPYYVQKMCEYIKDPANNVVYNSYFEASAAGDHRLSTHPQALAAYRQYCGP